MRRILYAIIILFLILGSIFIFQNAYINVDNLGKGKLVSVRITDNSCDLTVCSNENHTLEITNSEELKSLESVFFGKLTTNLFGFTKEKGNFDFDFIYEKANIKFSVRIDPAFKSGKIKYPDRERDYKFSTNDLKIIKTITDSSEN